LIIVDELVHQLEEWFPKALAESWDNTGLLLGDEQTPVERVMTNLSLTEASAEEAIREKADLVISHHPIFFRKVSRLTAQGPDRPAYLLARAGISLYSPHTSFDSASAGINEQWANLLHLSEVSPLVPAEPGQCKFVVFFPERDLEKVSQAMFAAGAGVIGEYRQCSFRMMGTGTFLGSENSNPSVGQSGRLEEVAELRLEVVVPAAQRDAVIRAIRASHSYEEPAFDIYPLQAEPSSVGTGRQGILPQATPLGELARKAGQAVKRRHVEIVGPVSALCRRVAIGCGSAGELIALAARAGNDVFVTGEARFHDYLEAERLGIHLILLGHYASERFAVEQLADRMRRQWPLLSIWASKEEEDPSCVVPIA
jgi:dinuclear metal center YbgI/SA1388 family protein